MERDYSSEITNSLDGRQCTVCGWVDAIRVLGSIGFASVRDRTGHTQITVLKKSPLFKILKTLTKESVVCVKGEVKANKEAPRGIEVIPVSIDVIGPAKAPLPMDVSGKIVSGLDTRLDSRYMDLRQAKVKDIFVFRDKILQVAREFFAKNGFAETATPKIVESAAEGGATLFNVDYFGRKAYLNQSPQLYKQMLMATGLDRVYEIAPAFRAEKSHTTQHLTEFTSLDFEQAFIDSQEDVMKTVEGLIVAIFKGAGLKAPKTPFKRITFANAAKMVGAKGDDLGADEEKELWKKVKQDFYFVTDFPANEKPFYIMARDDGTSCSFDLEYKGVELVSGGQREHRYKELVKRIKAKGLDINDFKFYTNAFRYGMPSHGGMGLGVERLVVKMLGLGNVREAVLFPRDPDRLVP